MLSSYSARSTSLLASISNVSACTAALCGIHCALTPILIVFLPALALSESVERGGWLVSIIIGALVFALGPTRRQWAGLSAFVFGASLWAASLAGVLEPIPEPWTSAAGSLIVAAALFGSARACGTGASPGCEAGSEGVTRRG